MYSFDRIAVYIFNWKKVTENSLKLYEKIKPIISDTTIINCDETRPIDNSIQLDDSHYYGSQYNQAIKHATPGKIFCVIVGDNIPNNNFELIFKSALDAFNSRNVGIYGIDDKRSSHKGIIGRHTDNLFDVANTDCGFWFIHPDIVSKLKHIDYSVSTYGWWIDVLTIKYAREHKFLVLRDYSVTTDQLDHTRGYNNQDAMKLTSGLISQFNSIE
jgi:hypothetical protein